MAREEMRDRDILCDNTGQRPSECPKLRCKDVVKKALKRHKIEHQSWKKIAEDRAE